MEEATLSDIGELGAIARIGRFLGDRRDIIQGIGDDCAVVRSSTIDAHDWVLTSDPVIEGTHFLRGTSPVQVGHKAIGRVLSDIAAMGGDPRWALVDLVSPGDTPASHLEQLYEGATALADRYGLAILGGDMACGPCLEVHVFAVGTVPMGRALLRSGAEPGDAIFVTGSPGGSMAGKHLGFEPRIREGVWLRDWATAAIDISDGLATDLRHLAHRSGTGARIGLAELPVSAAAREATDGSDVEHALCDGEDFELLFTVGKERAEELPDAWRRAFDLPCSQVGCMTADAGTIECVDSSGAARRLDEAGFAHWQPRP